jgi:hypothetical protein
MKQTTQYKNLVSALLLCMLLTPTFAQRGGCIFEEPILTIDFGSGRDFYDINTNSLQKYDRQYKSCPNDGNYSFVPYTSDCFNGDWHTFTTDHTPGDYNGNMMLINASETGGIFFKIYLKGLKGNSTYELAAWMVNVCRIFGGCPPLPPNIIITLATMEGARIATFQTGRLIQSASPHWKRYSGMFETPSDVGTVMLTMEDITLGGCGNDFALDDITIRECVKPTPIAKVEEKQINEPAKKEVPVLKTPAPKIIKTPPVKNDSSKPLIISRSNERDSTIKVKTQIKRKPVHVALPGPLVTRENILIKQIETVESDVKIQLYDNGEIDGDTVTIYHNNKEVVSKARLSEKPIDLQIKVNTMQPHHEFVMVANNLGSIPPNTSLMVITANGTRHEIFISSSTQKNAKVVINLKE